MTTVFRMFIESVLNELYVLKEDILSSLFCEVIYYLAHPCGSLEYFHTLKNYKTAIRRYGGEQSQGTTLLGSVQRTT